MEDNNSQFPLVLTEEFKEKVRAFREEWYQKYKGISKEPTPEYDGNGRKVLKQRPDGKDYIEDAWMTDRLNKFFPGWSWEKAGGVTFLGSEWVCADGELVIIDESLLAFGINPPVRKYWAGDAVRIQYKRDAPHSPENIVDIGDNVQSAITGAKKRAINRLCGIGDDVYGKRVEEEGAGTVNDMFEHNPDFNNFKLKYQKVGLKPSEVCQILQVQGLDKILEKYVSYTLAWTKITEVKGIK